MQNLWKTVSQWPIFMFGVLLGVFLNTVRPLVQMLKNPVTAIALVGTVIASLAFVGFTLRAMMGMNPV